MVIRVNKNMVSHIYIHDFKKTWYEYKPRIKECKSEEDGRFIKIKKSLKQKLKSLQEGNSQQNFL